jgi:DNA-binding HxlR family transcriptional regulator
VELKDLELNGFVRRTVSSDISLAVVYEATPYSATLHHVLQALSDWGTMHREHIKKGFQPTADNDQIIKGGKFF